MLKNKSLLVSVISLIITIVMMVTLCSVGFTASATETIDVWSGQAATGFAGGEGTKESPYKIENADQLYYLVSEVSKQGNIAFTKGKYFEITKDIYINDVSDGTPVQNLENPKSWGNGLTAPNQASNYRNFFHGTLNGNGHVIYGLYVYNYVNPGLFGGIANGAVVENLGFDNLYFESGAGSAGAIAGYANWAGLSGSTAKIKNCYVINATMVAGSSNKLANAGGFVGNASNATMEFSNCYAYNLSLTGSACNASLIGKKTTESTVKVYNSFFLDYITVTKTSNGHNNVKYYNVYTDKDIVAKDSGKTDADEVFVKLTLDQMKGSAAKENMQGFAWDEVWYTTENGYPTLTAPAAPEEPECEHENTKDAIIEEATYFKAGLKNIVCADDACGAMVETDVVIPAADVALKGDFTETFADGKLTIAWEYSDALALDIANGAVITFNYEIAGYKNAVELTGETGETVILEGFNADRLNAELTYNLSAVYGDVDTTKLNAVGGTVKAADIANDEKLDALLEALEADAVVDGKAENTQWLVSNIAKLDLKAAKAELNVAASQELIDALAAKGGRTDRAVKLIVKIGDDFTKEIEINDLRKYTIVTISGLSFEQLNGDISVQLVFDYVNDEYDFATDEIVFACGDMIADADTAATNAFVAYMN